CPSRRGPRPGAPRPAAPGRRRRRPGTPRGAGRAGRGGRSGSRAGPRRAAPPTRCAGAACAGPARRSPTTTRRAPARARGAPRGAARWRRSRRRRRGRGSRRSLRGVVGGRGAAGGGGRTTEGRGRELHDGDGPADDGLAVVEGLPAVLVVGGEAGELHEVAVVEEVLDAGELGDGRAHALQQIEHLAGGRLQAVVAVADRVEAVARAQVAAEREAHPIEVLSLLALLEQRGAADLVE